MSCVKCELNQIGERAYAVKGHWGTYTFDVAYAQQLVGDGRDPMVVPNDVLDKLLAVNHPVPEHLEHVREKVEDPGIIVRLGNRVALIDGTHRATLKRLEQRPFLAHMLSQKESEACLVGFPVPFRSGLIAA